MKVRLNGVPTDVEDAITLDRLVASLGLDGAPIAVELNRAVVRRGTYAARPLEAGDQIEIVTLVGGG